MKDILFVIDSMNGGGAEKILLDIVRNLDNNKYNVEILTIWNRGYYLSKIPPTIPHYSIIKDPARAGFGGYINALFEIVFKMLNSKILHTLFIRKKYDIEIAFLEGASTKLVAGSMARKYAWVHADMEANKWYEQFYRNFKEIQRTYQKYDTICNVSFALKESYERCFGQNNRSLVIYNPVDEASIIKFGNENPDIVFEHKTINFVSIGRIEFQKGYDRLVQIASNLLTSGYSFQLYILGEGSLKNKLMDRCNELGIDDNVHFLGYRSNPYPILKQADMFICSSRSEGFSTAVTEALVLGIPVLTTDCAGMSELLDHGKYGIICQNDDTALETAIASVLTNDANLVYFRAQSEIRGKSFCLSSSMKQIEELLDG